MNKKSILLGATALVLGAVALLPQTAFAYKGDPKVQGPNYTAERHAAMTRALAGEDYTAWKALMEGKGVARRITTEKFSKFAEAHRLALQGKTAEANAIRSELGIGGQNGNGMGGRNNQGRVGR